MSLSQTTDRGGSAIQIIPVTLTNGKLTDTLGTAVSLNVIGDVEFGFSMAGSESSDERNEVQLIHGITLSTPKVTKKIDKSGNEIVEASGGGGGTGNVLNFTCYEQDYTFLTSMQGISGGTFIVWFPLEDVNQSGFGWLLCRWDGDIRVKRSGNAHNGVSLSLVGKALELDSGSTAADVITALGTAVVDISQPGIAASAPSNPLNPETVIASTNAMLVAGDIANPGLLAGTLVFKKGS